MITDTISASSESHSDSIDVVANLAAVRAQIDEITVRSGRNPAEVTLVAVSKTKPFELIQQLYEAGQRDFGENRVEEALQKVEQAKAAGMDQIRWHFIGSVQSRKSSQVTGPFELLHSVDRVKLANRLSRDALSRDVNEADCVLSVLLQANVSGEESKQGFTPDELNAQLPELAALPNLSICGLMTMAPFYAEAEATRPVFRELRELRDALVEQYPEIELPELSMGMTNDFTVAIEEGATIVRVGSAIFGARN